MLMGSDFENFNFRSNQSFLRRKVFENTALKQGKVNLTWDETDPKRVSVMKKAFNADDDSLDDDVKAYLANSSDDDDVPQDLPNFGSGDDDIGRKLKTIKYFSCIH